MEEVLDQPLFESQPTKVKYGGFWPRLGALILDGLILAPVSYGLTHFNISSWKSTLVLVLISLIGIGYKPFMELTYGATLGKMALKLKVISADFEQAGLTQILLRNIFHIVPQLFTLLITVTMYNNPDFEEVSGWTDFIKFSQEFRVLQYISFTNMLITLIDAIMLATDDQKRSLHDRIGKTLVIDQS